MTYSYIFIHKKEREDDAFEIFYLFNNTVRCHYIFYESVVKINKYKSKEN